MKLAILFVIATVIIVAAWRPAKAACWRAP
jgi:hypothetical protein